MSHGLIIFDNDGVLVDSQILYTEAQLTGFAHEGFPVTEAWINQNLMGKRLTEVPDIFNQSFGKPITQHAIARVYGHFDELVRQKLTSVPGIPELLQQIAHIPSCIASSGTPDEIRTKLKHTKLTEYFRDEHIFSGTQVANGKPAPDLFLFAAQQMGFPPYNCIVIEDAIAGVQAGRAAGIYTVGFLGGSHMHAASGVSGESLLNAGADVIARTVHELLEIINHQQTLTAA